MRYIKTPNGSQLGLKNEIATSSIFAPVKSLSTLGSFHLYPYTNLIDPIRGAKWRTTWRDLLGAFYDFVTLKFDLGSAKAPGIFCLIDCDAQSGFVRLRGADDVGMTTSSIYYDLSLSAEGGSEGNSISGLHLGYLDQPEWAIESSQTYGLRLDPAMIDPDMPKRNWYHPANVTGTQGSWAVDSVALPLIGLVNGNKCVDFVNGNISYWWGAGDPVGTNVAMSNGFLSVACYIPSGGVATGSPASIVHGLVSYSSVATGSARNNHSFGYNQTTGKLFFQTGPVNSAILTAETPTSVAASVTLDQWHVLSVWRSANAANFKFYVDGYMVGQCTAGDVNTPATIASHALQIHRLGFVTYSNGSYYPFKGKIADVRYVNGTTFTQATVDAIHKAQLVTIGVAPHASSGLSLSLARRYWTVEFDTTMVSMLQYPDGTIGNSPAINGLLGVREYLYLSTVWLGEATPVSLVAEVEIETHELALRVESRNKATWVGHNSSIRLVNAETVPASHETTLTLLNKIIDAEAGKIIIDIEPALADINFREVGVIYGELISGQSSLKVSSKAQAELGFAVEEEV